MTRKQILKLAALLEKVAYKDPTPRGVSNALHDCGALLLRARGGEDDSLLLVEEMIDDVLDMPLGVFSEEDRYALQLIKRKIDKLKPVMMDAANEMMFLARRLR